MMPKLIYTPLTEGDRGTLFMYRYIPNITVHLLLLTNTTAICRDGIKCRGNARE